MKSARLSKMESQSSNLPPLLEQITNLAGTTKTVLLGFLKNGQVKASCQMEKDRIEICLACEKLTDDFRCQECGCFIKVKAKLLTANCPLRKWPQKEY